MGRQWVMLHDVCCRICQSVAWRRCCVSRARILPSRNSVRPGTCWGQQLGPKLTGCTLAHGLAWHERSALGLQLQRARTRHCPRERSLSRHSRSRTVRAVLPRRAHVAMCTDASRHNKPYCTPCDQPSARATVHKHPSCDHVQVDETCHGTRFTAARRKRLPQARRSSYSTHRPP
jgi:hypothetical protein